MGFGTLEVGAGVECIGNYNIIVICVVSVASNLTLTRVNDLFIIRLLPAWPIGLPLPRPTSTRIS